MVIRNAVLQLIYEARNKNEIRDHLFYSLEEGENAKNNLKFVNFQCKPISEAVNLRVINILIF